MKLFIALCLLGILGAAQAFQGGTVSLSIMSVTSNHGDEFFATKNKIYLKINGEGDRKHLFKGYQEKIIQRSEATSLKIPVEVWDYDWFTADDHVFTHTIELDANQLQNGGYQTNSNNCRGDNSVCWEVYFTPYVCDSHDMHKVPRRNYHGCEECPGGFYCDGINNYPCQPNCYQCSSGKEGDCSICFITHHLKEGNCLTSCGDGFYSEKADGAGNECNECDETCAKCSGPSANQCTHCEGKLGLWVQEKNLKQCIGQEVVPDGHWLDLANNLVKKCHATCATCNGGLKDNCLTCANSKTSNEPLVLDGSTCKSSCPDGKYADDSKVCQACEATCTTCKGADNDDCTSCNGALYLLNNVCTADCGDGYAQNHNDNTCEECDVSCETCSDSTSNGCLTCAAGLFLEGTGCVEVCPNGKYGQDIKEVAGGECHECHESCETCFNHREFSCLTCRSESFMIKDLASTQCVSECPLGTFAYGSPESKVEACQKECVDCQDENCAVCNGLGSKECLMCDDGFYLIQNECVLNCPDGTMGVWDETDGGQCYSCPEGCVECDAEQGCTACISANWTINEESVCVQKSQ